MLARAESGESLGRSPEEAGRPSPVRKTTTPKKGRRGSLRLSLSLSLKKGKHDLEEKT
jgi:hypothetical protein